MDLFLGQDVGLYIFQSGAYPLLGCARNLTGQITTDMAEIATRGTGLFAVSEPVLNRWTMQVEGLCNYDAQITDWQLQQLQLSFTQLTVNFTQVSQNGNTLNRAGNCWITSSSFAGNYNDFSNFNVSLVGTGPLTITNQPFNPLPNQKAVTPLNLSPAYGSGSVTVPAGVQVVAVRIGLNWYGVYSAGQLPDSEHVSYDVVTGIITFPVATAGETVTVLYQSL